MFDNKKYLFVEFKIFDEVNNKSTIVNFIKNVNIINKLKAKMFLNNNIIKSKNIILNVNKNIITINNCQSLITVFIVTNFDFSIKRLVKVANSLNILANSIITILYKLQDKFNLSINKNFIFIFQRLESLNSKSDILSHIVNAHINVM